jgi:hypothetical protein
MYKNILLSKIKELEQQANQRQRHYLINESQQHQANQTSQTNNQNIINIIYGEPLEEIERKEILELKQRRQIQKNYFKALMRHNRKERNFTNKF